jgi:hypothetical protein
LRIAKHTHATTRSMQNPIDPGQLPHGKSMRKRPAAKTAAKIPLAGSFHCRKIIAASSS